MKKTGWLLAVAAITALFFQCQKEVNFIGGPDTGGSVNPAPISASLQGNITDENDQPAAGVMVTAGSRTAVTDAKGYFRFNNASLDKNTSLVTASKDGYFKGYRVFAATSGCNQVAIKLIKKSLAGSVSSSTGGEVSLSNGSKVKLPAGGITTAASGSAYSGDVKVYASYINPGSSDISKIIPGSLVANNKDGKRVVLSSYGMLAVELSSAAGEKLQIKSGSTATLTIPISGNSLSTAPATIPLWYVDETTGIWQEEGTATRQGNNYVGEVKHFSFWNCDQSFDGVTLSMTIEGTDGSPLVNTSVSITSTISSDTSSYLSTAYGYTDSLGQVKGLVPANKDLQLQIISPCNGVAYSQSLAPLSADKDLGVIKITGSNLSIVTITGTLVDCSGSPVSAGYALIDFGTYTRYVKTDSATGNFSTQYFVCSASPATVSITGVDNSTQQQGTTTTVNVTAPVTNTGNIAACGVSSSQYINYSIDGTSYSISGSSSDSLIAGTTDDSSHTSLSGSSTSYYISMIANGGAVGTFPMTTLYLSNNNYFTTDLDQSSTVTFTTFPASVGSFYEGSLNGSFASYRGTDSAVTHTITGTFRVRRNQ